MKKKLMVSIVIPVYNEKENILKTLAEIKKYITSEHEIIIVYDSDNDTTLKVLKHIKQPNLHVVKNSIYPGPSGAIRTGLAKAQAPRVLVTMADLCDDLSQVESFIVLVPQSASIICPTRYSKGGKQLLRLSLKALVPRIAGIIMHIFGGVPTYDPTNSYKLYSKKMLDSLTLKSTVSFSVTLEIVVKAYVQGYAIVEIPTVWRDRQHGKTNFKFGRSLITYFPWLCYAIVKRPFIKKR
jgi:dolichol-phosphate mannosyltransferase